MGEELRSSAAEVATLIAAEGDCKDVRVFQGAEYARRYFRHIAFDSARWPSD